MDIVKKNIISIICGVVALITLIALAYPISGMFADTGALLDKEKTVDSGLTKLVNTKRFWPVIPELDTGAQSPLNRFPNDAVIGDGLDIKKKVSEQAVKMKDATSINNKHVLLVPDILPNPRDERFRFQSVYLEAVQKNPRNPNGDSNLRALLTATTPPTDQDVLDEAKRLYIAEFQPKIINVGGKDVNKDQIDADWLKVCPTLAGKLRVKAAQSAKMYLEPDWITIQGQMLNNPNGPREVDIWYAQNMLWVQQDIVEAIVALNANARNVTDAPIKHLFRLEVADDATQYVMNSQNGAAANASPTDAPGKAFNVSPTGRVCNPLYDVIRFQLVMNVEARRIPTILAELQCAKLITVEQMDLSAVDGIAAAEEGYVYGDVPVVRLTIQGEELFLRDWTVPLMPDPIKTLLQVSATPAGPGPAPKRD